MKFNEAHKRTIVKTITFRIMFTCLHIFNGWVATGSWVLGAAIAGVNAIVGTILFWTHERVWNRAQWNRKEAEEKVWKEGHPRTISKSLSWRILATVILNFAVPYILSGSLKSAFMFLTLATLINVIAYYLHERAWNMVKWAKTVEA